MTAKRWKRGRHPVLWILSIFQCAAVILPLAVLGIWCFAERWPSPDILPEELGLQNIQTVLSIQPDLLELVLFSVGLSLVVSFICVFVSLLVGHALAFYDFRGKYALDFLTFLPIIIPATAFGMGLHVFMLRAGLANNVVGVVLSHVIVLVPYSIKMLTDSLRLMGRSLYEQAWSFGAGSLRAFLDAALVPLMPSIVSALSIVFIGSFGQYFLTYIIGGGKVSTLSLAMFPWVASPDRGTAAVYAVTYLAVSLVVFVLLDMAGKIVVKNQRTQLM